FKEVDYRRMFAPLAKWVAQIDDAARIPELVSQAFHRAVAGRPGPVVIALPEDMLTSVETVADAGPYRTVRASPAAADMARLREMLERAQHQFMILGGRGWSAQAVADIRDFAEPNGLPVGCASPFQDLLDNRHPN